MGEMSRREDERLKKHQQGAMEGKVTKHKLTCSLTHIGLLFLLSHTHTDSHTHTHTQICTAMMESTSQESADS